MRRTASWSLRALVLSVPFALGCASQPLDKSGGASGNSSTPIGTGGAEGGTGAAGGDSSDSGGSGGQATGGTGGLGGAPTGTGGAPITHPGDLLLDAVHISSDGQAEYFQKATVEADFGNEPVARATLFVELSSPCFPFDNWTRASIPAGHSWPEKCDAFDRGFEISLDEPESASDGPPGLELARAITPFGGPLSMQFDVTDSVNGLPGKHQFSVKIGTWPDPDGKVSGAKGEWIVSAWLDRELGTPPRRVLAVIPLAYGSETSATTLPIAFDAPEGASSARIDYRVTGHGGGPIGPRCIGPAEEFCRRTHSLYVDQELVEEFEPWRTDCAQLCNLQHYQSTLLDIDYCAENPCGAPASVRASRANWCPGSVTDTHAVESPALAAPGPHEFSWNIDTVAEGGSWLLSATYYAFE